MKIRLVLTLALMSCAQIPAMSEDSIWSSQAFHPGKQFKLHALWDEAEMPLVALPARNVPKIDASMVTQIRQFRQELPNLHGMHAIVPGVSSP